MVIGDDALDRIAALRPRPRPRRVRGRRRGRPSSLRPLRMHRAAATEFQHRDRGRMALAAATKFQHETAAAWRSPRPMNEPTQRQEGREMFDDFHKQAAELVLDVAEKSGLLQAAAEKLCLALGDDGEMREALAEAFDRQAADMNRPPRRCPECDGRVPRLRCAECNYKLRGADLLPELWAAQRRAAERQAREATNAQE
jgi:hypothetical protein